MNAEENHDVHAMSRAPPFDNLHEVSRGRPIVGTITVSLHGTKIINYCSTCIIGDWL